MKRFLSSPRRSRTFAFALIVLVLTVLVWGPGSAFGSPPTGEQRALTGPVEALATITLTADADVTVKYEDPDTNFSGLFALELYYSQIDIVREGAMLVHFDLSSLPANAVIDSATLEMYLIGTVGPTVNVAVYYVTSSWSESTVTWNTNPTVDTPALSFSLNSTVNEYKSRDITSYAQAWYSTPAQNHGILLKGPTNITYSRTFESQDHNENIPRLVVNYHIPTATPTQTPTTVAPPTDTPTAEGPTSTFTPTPTRTPIGVPTDTPTRRITDTPTPTPTATRGQPEVWEFSGQLLLAADPDPLPAPESIQVGLYGANSLRGLGEQLAVTETREDGAFTVTVSFTATVGMSPLQDIPYFNLAVIDERYSVRDAWSESGGELTDQGWIRFHEPAAGEYPDNTFVIEPVGDIISRTFSGQIFRRHPDGRDEPWPRIPVGLLKANVTCDEGFLVAEILTDEQGRFDLAYVTSAEEDSPYYNLIVRDENIRVVGAQSESGGYVTDQGWIQFQNPQAGELAQNNIFAEPILGQQVFSNVEHDAYVSAQAPDGKFGTAPVLFTGYSSGPDRIHNRTFIDFDLDYLPQSAKVFKATLHVYLEQAGGLQTVCMSVHRVLQSWSQSSITWKSQPSYALVPSTTHYVNSVAGFKTWDVTSLVQSWLDGSESDYGLALLGPEEGSSWSRRFSSFEGSQQPRLVIHLQSGTPFVTPTSTPTATLTPTPTPSSTPVDRQVQITAIEVNQAVQDLNNTVPLVSGKKTVVRVHLKMTDGKGSLSGVSGFLHYPYGTGGPIYSPINPAGFTVKANPNRGVLNDTLNFIIPGTQATGSGFVLIDINAPSGITFNGGQVELVDSRLVNFGNVPAMRLRLVGVRYVTNTVTYQPRNLDYARTESWLRAAYPIGTLNSSRTTTNFPAAQGMPGCGAVNTLLATMKVADVNGGTATNATRYHGLVFEGGPAWYFMQGCCCNSGASSGPTGAGAWGWDNDGSYGDWYAGHEIGHGYGQCHSGFCRGQGKDTSAHCTTYPYPGGNIGGIASSPNRYYGIDAERMEVYGPNSKDLMTYCNDLWISDFNYQRIRNRMLNPLAFSMAPSQPVERLLVVGMVDMATDAVELSSFLRIPDASETVERVPGEYVIVLFDGEGARLAEYPFTPRVQVVDEFSQGASCSTGATEEPADELASIFDTAGPLSQGASRNTGAAEAANGPASIFEFVPWHPDTARVSIFHGDQELAAREISPNEPEVHVLSPNGGEVFGGEALPIAWEANDNDDDPLTFTVLYSSDEGATWLTLATGLEQTSLEADSGMLSGSGSALIRVMVSDGLNTTADESDATFTLEGSKPQVSITSPTEGARFGLDDVIALTGDAYDPEDGTLEGEALFWESDRDGPLGNGVSLVLAAKNLTSGPHQITLTASDGDGMVGSASINIVVNRRLYLPLLYGQ